MCGSQLGWCVAKLKLWRREEERVGAVGQIAKSAMPGSNRHLRMRGEGGLHEQKGQNVYGMAKFLRG